MVKILCIILICIYIYGLSFKTKSKILRYMIPSFVYAIDKHRRIVFFWYLNIIILIDKVYAT